MFRTLPNKTAMRLTSPRYWTLLLLSALMSLRTQAQPSPKDSALSDTAYPSYLQAYHSYVAPEVGFYRGNQYVDYDLTVQQGQPFFGPDSIRVGSVWCNGGILYARRPILYDEVKQQVIVSDPFHIYKIGLFMDFVDSFELDGHPFSRIYDSLAPAYLKTGIYERVYEGRIVLLKRERKFVRENLVLTTDGIRNFIDSSDSYYLKIKGAYRPFNSKREVYDALADRRTEVRRLIRKLKLSWRRDREFILLRVVSWYDDDNH
jgi:hypothetical protein